MFLWSIFAIFKSTLTWFQWEAAFTGLWCECPPKSIPVCSDGEFICAHSSNDTGDPESSHTHTHTHTHPWCVLQTTHSALIIGCRLSQEKEDLLALEGVVDHGGGDGPLCKLTRKKSHQWMTDTGATGSLWPLQDRSKQSLVENDFYWPAFKTLKFSVWHFVTCIS